MSKTKKNGLELTRVGQARTLAQARVLWAPVSFLTASLKTLYEVCNGCGAANAKFDFIPDKIYGTYIGHACNIHDWMYDIGRTIEDKEEADRVLLNNILRLINREDKWYKPKSLMRMRAKEYYFAVKHFGGPAFWSNKN